jgi:hypothetical protein
MSDVPYPPTRQLSVGEVLDLSFRIYRVTVVRCLLFAGFGVIAGQLANLYNVFTRHTPVSRAATWDQVMAQMRDPTLWTLYVIGAVLTLVFYAAVLLRQRAIIGDAPVGGEVAAALRRLPALIGLGMLILLCALLCVLPALLTAGAARGLLALAAVIALCYGFVAISCSQTVLLVEGGGPATSLARSWRLTTGSFWRLSLIYTVALVVLMVLYAVTAAIAGFLAGVLGRGDLAMVTAFAEVVGVALGALATPFYGALALAVLADLKIRKEGADLEQRISATA